MSKSPKTLIVVATYNEIENVPRLVEQVLVVVPAADLLVIDDSSPDGTGQWCETFAATEPRLRVIHRPAKSGLGSATLRGLREAIEGNYDVVATMDADLSHPPDRLPALLEPARNDQADVVIGSRYVAGGRIEGWPWTRRVMSRAVNLYARIALRLPTRDCSGAFRAYRVARLAVLPPESVTSRGYAYLEELLWRLKRQGARFVEVPITFTDRQFGRSKINGREALAALAMLARYGLQEWCAGRHKPDGEASPRGKTPSTRMAGESGHRGRLSRSEKPSKNEFDLPDS